MSLTREDVLHISKLSRISLTDAEVEKFQVQLSAIIGYIDQLNEVDTTGIEPTINTTGIIDRMREDLQKASFTQEEALSNSKDTHNGFFAVPNVFDN
ncbi:MAG: Asp-tRNA(Asn)/Glu-tRNA(Gln) amidotransferase subunit GatC [bacterium]|nr:Asp-tRNA(Asn)/Glu-tRNA(Gln) amidotransferase subunit GatC [bacterium]